MEFTITGTVKQVLPAETKGNFTWRNLRLIIDEDSKYPQVVELQYPIKDGKDYAFDLQQGQKVNCQVNLRGREWNDKVFNTLSAWRIEKVGSAQPQPQPQSQPQPQEPNDSSLPF